MVGREAWHENTPTLEEAAYRRGRRNADSGEIVVADLTTNNVDDVAQVGPLLDQLEGSVASFTADGAYDQDGVYQAVMDRDPEALVIVPPRCKAVLSETAQTMPTQRDRHIQCIAEKGRMGWQKISPYNRHARDEIAIGRFKCLMGDGLRFHQDERRATEVAVAVHVLNRMLELRRPISVRICMNQMALLRPTRRSMQQRSRP